jgi:peptidyl-prolyl cis-trans isomerase D
MLQKIREGVGRWIAGVILALIAVAFIFWGVDPTIMGTTFAAKVNGDDVALADFERALQIQQSQYQELYRVEISDDLQREFRLSVLERLILSRALSQRVQSQGYRISDERLSEAIRSRPAFQVDGVFSMDVYRSQLLYEGIPPSLYEEEQREQLGLLELQNGLANSAFYTPRELARYMELYYQERELSYALFETDSFRDQIELDESEILTYYEDNKARFYSEESVDLEYIEVLRAEIAADIEVNEEILLDYYEQEQYRFRTEEERRARHILINSIDENPEVEARATEILGRLEAGEEFEALAGELSEDAGTSNQGGDLGWVSSGLLVGPFEDTLFAMEVGDVQGPVKTDFGYHIIRLEEIREGDVQTFEAVREELSGEYQSGRAEELFFDQANGLADGAFDAFDELASLATDMGLALQTLGGFTRTDSMSPFETSAPVAQVAFSPEVLEQRENSGLVEVTEDHVLVLRVVDHHLPAEQPLQAVRAEIEEELIQSAAEALADAAAVEFLAQMMELPFESAVGPQVVVVDGPDEAPEETVDGTEETAVLDEPAPPVSALAALASENGGTWIDPRWVERTDPTLPTEILTAAFRRRQPNDEAVSEQIPLASGDQTIVTISGVRSGDADSLTQEEQQQEFNRLADQTALYEMTSYAGEVREQADVRIPEVVLDPPLFY